MCVVEVKPIPRGVLNVLEPRVRIAPSFSTCNVLACDLWDLWSSQFHLFVLFVGQVIICLSITLFDHFQTTIVLKNWQFLSQLICFRLNYKFSIPIYLNSRDCQRKQLTINIQGQGLKLLDYKKTKDSICELNTSRTKFRTKFVS